MIGTIEKADDMTAEVYQISGLKGTSSDAVAQVKKEFASEHDVSFSQVSGRKLTRNRERALVIVAGPSGDS